MKKKLSIEKAATEFRGKLGIDSYNSINIHNILKQLNVITVFKKLNENFSGLSLKIADFRFMLINSAHTIGRQNFTICHELYHLFIQKEFEKTICEENTGKDIEEDNANIFASNLLLPREGLLGKITEEELKINKIKIYTMLDVEQYFACSHKALLYRLLEIGIVNKKYIDEENLNIKEVAEQYGYNTNLYEPGNDELVLGDYGKKARNLYENNIISESHYLELMSLIGINLNELEK